MPILDPITNFPIPEDYGNSGLDSFTAGMALSNPISGWADRRFSPNYKPDLKEESTSKYDPWADPRIKKYDPMFFVDSQSDNETTNIIDSIDRNTRLLDRNNGISGIAGTITGVFTNPLIILPAIATSGSSIPAMIAAETGDEILSEMTLSSQQPLRTKVESALNIGLAGVAAGIGGVIQRKLAKDTISSAPREATDTAHGGDGMYASPIPSKDEVQIPVTAGDSIEDAAIRAGDENLSDAKVLEKEFKSAEVIVKKATTRVEAARAAIEKAGC